MMLVVNQKAGNRQTDISPLAHEYAMRVVIIIPVFNESSSTELLIRHLAELVTATPQHEIEVLYIDGGSTDGTQQIIEKQRGTLFWLRLLVENERCGLGSAYALGFRYVLDHLKADYVLEFDGDLQHRVSDIPKLLAKAEEGYDYVIGSRFVRGGEIPHDWGVVRVVLSRGGNWFGRWMLGLQQIRDLTSGYKLSRVKGFLDTFDFAALLSKRHAYKIHLLHHMLVKGARVIEVPIVFEPRKGGESKLIKNDLFDTLRVIFKLRWRRLR